MAKKNFKDNPALHFITPPAPARPAPSGAAAKPSRAKASAPSPAAEAPLKPNPLYVETKSKRVQLLMQPSLHARLRDLAAGRGQSLNELIHTVLGGWVDRES